jgi:hypothetical protein
VNVGPRLTRHNKPRNPKAHQKMIDGRCRIAVRRRKGSARERAHGEAAPLPRRSGMRPADRVFPEVREGKNTE